MTAKLCIQFLHVCQVVKCYKDINQLLMGNGLFIFFRHTLVYWNNFYLNFLKTILVLIVYVIYTINKCTFIYYYIMINDTTTYSIQF